MASPSTTTLRQSSPVLGMSWGRYPGPVWTLIAWSLLSGLNLLFAITFPANNKPPDPTTVGTCLYALLIVVTLLVLGARTPGWLLLAFLVGAIGATTVLVHGAITPLGGAVFALPYIVYSSYAALWWSRRVAVGLLGLQAIAYFAVLTVRSAMPYMLVTWLVIMSICTGLVLLLSYLVTHLVSIATIDPLTGLLNRTGLMTLLELAPNSGRRTQPRAVVVIDLDGLKTVNDSLGHRAGDEVLQGFGRALRDIARADDIIARTGGDEFVVVLPVTTPDQAQSFLRRLGENTEISWSYGVSAWQPDMTYDEAIANADERMYEAKRDRRRR